MTVSHIEAKDAFGSRPGGWQVHDDFAYDVELAPV